VFDEVKTGFRLAPGGAQEYYGLVNDKAADITTYAKALGGGFPISAIVGRKDIMELVVPGKVHHAGTYTANPVSVAASNATLDELSKNDFEAYRKLRSLGAKLQNGLSEEVERSGLRVFVQGVGHGGFAVYFTRNKVTKIRNYREYANNIDTETYNRFHKLLLRKGVYFHSQQYEQIFISSAHSEEDVFKTIEGVRVALKSLAS
jgi:glutamate-1-semialdehyde 2,1-aminomutase